MKGPVLASLMLAAPAASACDIALMLAVDVSGSVDATEYRIQMDGLAAALTHRSISSALVASEAQVAVMQWTGSGRQTVVLNWTRIQSERDVIDFAYEVSAVPRLWRDFSTAIGEALDLAIPYFALVEECERHVIDISGDGINNEGIAPREVWPRLQEAGIIVNALVIETTGFRLTDWFESDVITGPGAFAVTANSYQDYPEQIIRKLYLELTTPISSND